MLTGKGGRKKQDSVAELTGMCNMLPYAKKMNILNEALILD